MLEALQQIEKQTLLGQWQDDLRRLGDCKEQDAEHTGYRKALQNCINQLREVLEQDVLSAELPWPPAHWRVLGSFGPNGHCFDRRWKGARCTVIRTVGVYANGSAWAHVSVSRADRLPNWEEMMEIKADFLGDLGSVQVAPPGSQSYVNFHPNCLHWWAPLDRWPLPDFTLGGKSI